MTRAFEHRGMKGWAWTIDQYLEEIPVLASLDMTFLMNCYISLCDLDRWGQPGSNRWWEPLPPTLRAGLERVVRECRAAGLEFWFSMNPNLFATRFATVDDAGGLEALWRHYAWMQGLGVRWFSVALDDIGQGTDAVGQAALVNELVRRLRLADPDVEMVLCPTIYWGDGSEPGHAPYLGALAERLDPAVRVFWTGDAVVTPTITRRAAEAYRAAIERRLVIWDNYPCNDGAPTMHLGPLVGRDPGLATVADGYMTNPMRTQNRLGRIPLATAADYAQSPMTYDPAKSIEQAIDRLAHTPAERDVLADLVALYPGSIAAGENQYFNPVRASAAAASPRDRPALADRLAIMVRRFEEAFGDRYQAELATLEADLAFVRSLPAARR
jgi:hypothetical protein